MHTPPGRTDKISHGSLSGLRVYHVKPVISGYCALLWSNYHAEPCAAEPVLVLRASLTSLDRYLYLV